jgi:hypothetical protein
MTLTELHVKVLALFWERHHGQCIRLVDILIGEQFETVGQHLEF